MCIGEQHTSNHRGIPQHVRAPRRAPRARLLGVRLLADSRTRRVGLTGRERRTVGKRRTHRFHRRAAAGPGPGGDGEGRMGLSAADVRVLSLGTGEAVMAVRPADGGLHSLLRAAVCVRQGRAAQARLAPGWAAAPLPRQRHLRRGRRFGAPGSGRVRPAKDVQVDVGDATVEHQRHDWCVPPRPSSWCVRVHGVHM